MRRRAKRSVRQMSNLVDLWPQRADRGGDNLTYTGHHYFNNFNNRFTN